MDLPNKDILSKVYLLLLLTVAIDGDWSTSRPGRFTPEKDPQYPLNRRLFGGPRAGVDVLEKIKVFCVHRDSNPGLSGR
jgi:hypothetical protein